MIYCCVKLNIKIGIVHQSKYKDFDSLHIFRGEFVLRNLKGGGGGGGTQTQCIHCFIVGGVGGGGGGAQTQCIHCFIVQTDL